RPARASTSNDKSSGAPLAQGRTGPCCVSLDTLVSADIPSDQGSPRSAEAYAGRASCGCCAGCLTHPKNCQLWQFLRSLCSSASDGYRIVCVRPTIELFRWCEICKVLRRCLAPDAKHQ